jgi:hypothetical protein
VATFSDTVTDIIGLVLPAYLTIPGTSGSYARTPDSVANSTPEGLKLVMCLQVVDWTPAARRTLMSKYASPGNNRSWALWLNTGGTLRFQTFTDGTATGFGVTFTSNALPFIDGAVGWIMIDFVRNNGSGTAVGTFYTSQDGVTWTQLGLPLTVASPSATFDTAAPLEIGTYEGGTGEPLVGKVFRAQLYKDGVLANDFNPYQYAPAATGETWTLFSTATITNPTSGFSAPELDMFSTVSDNVVITDALANQANMNSAVNDVLVVTDETINPLVIADTVVDTGLVITDSTTAIQTYFKFQSDNLVLTDLETAQQNITSSIADTLAVGDMYDDHTIRSPVKITSSES